MKCDLDESLDAEELEQCHVQNVQNWWYGCLGDYCGATLPEGVCAQKCIPPLEEGIALCDGKVFFIHRSCTIEAEILADVGQKLCLKTHQAVMPHNVFLDALANGEINQIEHYKCVMGPGGPGPTWEQCTAECICDQPFCNCVPPEEGTSSETWFQPNLRDTTITCYPDPEE